MGETSAEAVSLERRDGVAIVTLACTIVLYIIIPKGLLPQQDTGLIIGVTDAAQNISFRAMAERQRHMVDIVLQDPDVASVTSFVGTGTINATLNTGRLSINLQPRDRRHASADQVIARLRESTRDVRLAQERFPKIHFHPLREHAGLALQSAG